MTFVTNHLSDKYVLHWPGAKCKTMFSESTRNCRVTWNTKTSIGSGRNVAKDTKKMKNLYVLVSNIIPFSRLLPNIHVSKIFQ